MSKSGLFKIARKLALFTFRVKPFLFRKSPSSVKLRRDKDRTFFCKPRRLPLNCSYCRQPATQRTIRLEDCKVPRVEVKALLPSGFKRRVNIAGIDLLNRGRIIKGRGVA